MTHYPGEESRRQVTQLSALGWTMEEIADFMGIHHETLRKHYKQEVRRGRSSTYHVATAKLYEKIKAGEYRAITFWLRTQHGWKDRIVLEHAGAVVVDKAKAYAELTDDELETLERVARRIHGAIGSGDDPEGEGAASPAGVHETDPPEL